MKHTTARRAFVLAITLAMAPAALPAQDAPEARDLPPAEELIDRYVEALGGRAAVLALPGSHARGTFRMPAAGLEGPIEIYSGADPDRSVTVVEIPGLGTIREGYTGEYAWAMDPNMGPRLLEGDELAAARENSSTLGQLRDASMFTERTTVERTEMNDEPCYRVKLVWKSGRETFDCYSVETGLIVAREVIQPTPMGDIPVIALVGGYEEHGGVMMATEMRQQMMGQEQVVEVESIEIREVDPERFAPPAAVQALIDQRESGD